MKGSCSQSSCCVFQVGSSKWIAVFRECIHIHIKLAISTTCFAIVVSYNYSLMWQFFYCSIMVTLKRFETEISNKWFQRFKFFADEIPSLLLFLGNMDTVKNRKIRYVYHEEKVFVVKNTVAHFSFTWTRSFRKTQRKTIKKVLIQKAVVLRVNRQTATRMNLSSSRYSIATLNVFFIYMLIKYFYTAPQKHINSLMSNMAAMQGKEVSRHL